MHPDQFTESALFDAVTNSQQLEGIYAAGAPVTATWGTQDRKVLVAGTHDGRVLRWDPPNEDASTVMNLAGEVRFVAVSEDGERIVASAYERGPEREITTHGAGEFVETQYLSPSGIEELGFPVNAMSPSGRTLVGNGYAVGVHNDGTYDGSETTLPYGANTAVMPNDKMISTVRDNGELARIKNPRRLGSEIQNQHGPVELRYGDFPRW